MHIDNNNRKKKRGLTSNLSKFRKSYVTKAALQTLKEFCDKASIHGCYFVAEYIKDTNHPYAKNISKICNLIAWLGIILSGFGFAIYLILLVWCRFQESPVITLVETNNYPIWNIDFPAVTVCNVNLVHKPNTVNITQFLEEKGISTEDIDDFYFNLKSLVYYREANVRSMEIFKILESIGYTSETLMFELAQPCESLVKKCKWANRDIPCEKIFRMVKSDLGFCCSFNYKILKPIPDVLSDSNQDFDVELPIFRAFGAGEGEGLNALLNVAPEDYVAPGQFFYGIKILLHGPKNFPQKSNIVTLAQSGQDISIVVNPSVLSTDKSIKALAEKLRLCRFPDESDREYNFPSCFIECRVRTIIKKCGCLPYFYPPIGSNDIFRFCTLRDGKCLRKNTNLFFSLHPPWKVNNYFNYTETGMFCDCLPLCNQKSYDRTALIANTIKCPKFVKYFNNTMVKYTLLKVFYKDFNIIKYRQQLFMTWDALLASCGGIFGLCVGGSFISFIEIFYYATYKFYEKIIIFRKQNQNQKQLIPNLIKSTEKQK